MSLNMCGKCASLSASRIRVPIGINDQTKVRNHVIIYLCVECLAKATKELLDRDYEANETWIKDFMSRKY